MLFSRQFVKFSRPAKELLNIKYAVNGKQYFIRCGYLCKQNTQAFRYLATTSIRQGASTVPTNESNIPSEAKITTKSTTNSKYNPLDTEELLEKFIASLSTDIYQKNRVYKNSFLKVLSKVKELNFSSKKQGLLLIRCCTELLADESPTTRMELVQQVWNTLKPHTTFEVEHYNELLRVYIANHRPLVVRTFFNHMEPVKPNITTFELVLRALGETGDLNQATEVIANMKAMELPATEDVFNSLIICQGKCGNMKNMQEVLTMMKSLKIPKSADTYVAVARGLAYNKQNDLMFEELERGRSNGIKFEEHHIMTILKTLASIHNYIAIPKVLRYLPEETLKTPSISPYMQIVATQLVFQNHPMAALEIYKCLPLPSFGPKDDQGLHGRSFVRDCVKAAIPSSVIGLITQELMASGRNPVALQNAAEAALQQGRVPLALDLFTRMKQIGLPLRPHYFWPILLHTSKTSGEKGIMNVLKTMMQMEVTPDYETIMSYTLPYVSFTSPQNLMKKFVEAGLSVGTVLTPTMETLLNTGQVRAASEIYRLAMKRSAPVLVKMMVVLNAPPRRQSRRIGGMVYSIVANVVTVRLLHIYLRYGELFIGKIDAEKLMKPLHKGHQISLDTKSTVYILEDLTQKALDKNKDWVGRFLCTVIQSKKNRNDFGDFADILKALKERNLKISTSAADFCISHLPQSGDKEKMEAMRSALVEITNERLIDEGEMFVHQIPHPKHMNEEALRAHLGELEAKGMNTRGVLRKLLQECCRSGNLAAAREIVDKCQKEGVFLSAGMKAAIFDLHVKLGEYDLAELALADLNKTSPNFVLDEFKVIDFATLMVYRKKIDKAFELIEEQSKKRNVVGGRNIIMNCWRLLDAMAAHTNPENTRDMFEVLVDLGYCTPSNVVLGPLIRAHLKNNNVTEAVNEFTRLANEYNKTPLKHELLCKILVMMADGKSEDAFLTSERSNSKLNKLVQKILNVDKKVHGLGDVQLTLIAALAEVGYKKTLRKMLLDPTVKIHPDALYRRCERFADERKVGALEAIAECARDIRQFDVTEVCDMILNVLQREDEVDKALELWQRMQEADITPTQKFIRTLIAMASANNKTIPLELAALLDKDPKKMTKEN